MRSIFKLYIFKLVILSITMIFMLQSCKSLPPLMLEDKWAQDCTRDYGLKKGTIAYGNCINNFRQQNQRDVNAIMNMRNPYLNNFLNQGQWQTPNYNNNVTPNVNRGRLTNQVISGQNRLCYYNSLGATSVVTVRKHQICP